MLVRENGLERAGVMAENWESWLRGDNAKSEGASEKAPPLNEDVAALLGLPLALARRAKEELPEEARDITPPSEDETPLTLKARPEEEPALIEVPLEREALYVSAKEDPQEGPEVPPSSTLVDNSSLFSPEREKVPVGPSRTAKALTLGSAGAALVLGAYLYFVKETADELIAKAGADFQAGEYSQALEGFHKALKKDPAAFGALFGIADTLEKLGRKGEAVDGYYRCLQVNPSDPQIYKRLAFLLLSMGSYDNALRSFHESVNLNPSDGEVFFGLGNAYEAKEDFVQAVSAFRRAGDLEPGSEKYEEALKRSEEKLSTRVEEAEKQERIFLAEEAVSQGQAALERGDLEGARDFFLKAATVHPGDHGALVGLGDVNKLSGNLDAAAGYYEAALQLHPESFRAKASLAEVKGIMDGLSAGKKAEAEGNGTLKSEEEVSQEGKTESPPLKNDEPQGDILAEKPDPNENLDKSQEAPRPSKDGQKIIPRPELTGKGKVGKITPLGASLQREGKLSLKPTGADDPPKRRPPLPPPKTRASVKPPRADPPVDGAIKSLEQFEKGNYSLAFSHLWDKMIATSDKTHGLSSAKPRLFGGSPFAEGRWRDIAPVKKGPLGEGIPSSVPLPTSRVAASSKGAKDILLEAVNLNLDDEALYLNLYLSFILQGKKSGEITVDKEEALCYSLLAHAWLKKGEKDKGLVYLNAAKKKAPRDFFDRLLPLEELFSDEKGG